MTFGNLKVQDLIYEDASNNEITVILSNLATKASPTFTGTVTVPTASANDNTTKAASTAYVQTELGDYLTTATATSTYAPKANPAFTGTATGVNLTLSGDLTVNGTTTTINTTTLQVEDKNIEIGKVASPSDTTADGGGWSLLGSTTKTFNWVNATDAWTSSEHIHITEGKKLILGSATSSSNDFQLIHDGTNTFMQNKTGYLKIANNVSGDVGGDILIQAMNGEDSIKCIHDGAVELYHNNVKKIETTSGGINVTGAISVNGAALSAAPEITATADGAIAANKPVRVNDDGTISEIKNTALSAATGSNTDIPHQYNPKVKASVWISSTKFILFWIADNNSDKLNAAVGTASGTSISYGSRIEIATNSEVHRVSASYDSSLDVVLVAYGRLNSSGYVKGLTVSGTTITVNGTGHLLDDQCSTVDIASDNKGGFIFCWVNTSQQWYVKAGTVTSAGAISVGSNVHIASSRTVSNDYNTMSLCYDKNSDAWVSICRFNNNTDFAVFTRSGTVATKTSASTPPTIISGTDNSSVNIVYFETEQRFLITSRSNSGSNPLKYATPKMNAGTTSLDTGGSGTLFAAAQDNMGFLAYDKGSNKAFYIFADDTNSDTKLLTITLNASGTISGTGSVTSEQLASHKEQSLAVACNGEGLVLTGVDKSDDSDVLSRLKQLAVTVSNLKGDSFIGFSTDAISNSASGTINVVGNTATLSGLTPSKKYYVQKGGTVSTAADDPSVVAGVAISSTKLLIKG